MEDELQTRMAEIEERKRRRRERDENDLRKVLSHSEGRRFVWRLMEHTRIFHQTYTGNSETFFNEGKRSIGLLVLGEMMSIKPDAFTQMQKEAASDPLKVMDQKGTE